MSEMISNEALFTAAERVMRDGGVPTLDVMAEALSCDPVELKEPYEHWWALLAGRMRSGSRTVDVSIHDVPDTINTAFSRIWNEALHEAYNSFNLERRYQNVGAEELQRHHEEELHRTRARIDEVEDRHREQVEVNGDAQLHIKALEAEVKALKASLTSETGQRKDAEHKTSKIDQELMHLRRSADEARRTFEQRLKDEQRSALESVSKSEADVRYYRGALEKVRDESGKKESALTKTIHDIKAELAKKDVKIESHLTQIKSLESSLKLVKQERSGLSRDLAKLNSTILTEANKNKRLEEKVVTQQEDLRVAQQKKVAAANEAARRENALRTQLSEREDEIMRLRGRNTVLEKRMITLDEEIRRAKSSH
ncbi:MAG: hypothetical protein ACPGF7_13380 [Pontibacterium sp.]